MNNVIRKAYTAAYSQKAGKDGTAADSEPLHIVELKLVNESWITDGIAMCGVHAERRNGRIIAAQGKGVDNATCRRCKFEHSDIASKRSRTQRVETRVANRNAVVAEARRIMDAAADKQV